MAHRTAPDGHAEPEVISLEQNKRRDDKPISNAYPVIDNDLARDNLENDIPAADLEDL